MAGILNDIDPIQDTPFDEALSQRYLVYALSTITARSLPDLRDGLQTFARFGSASGPRRRQRP